MKTKLACLIIGSLLLSCHDILEEKPLRSVTIDQFYQTEKDALAAVNAVYGATFHPWVLYSGQGQWHMDLSTDDIETTPGNDWSGFNYYRFNNDSGQLFERWYVLYQAVSKANIAIEKIPGIQMDESLKARLMGELHALRAINYFNLANLFGGVPIVKDFVSSLSEDLTPARNTVSEVHTFIEEDFMKAEIFLADAPLIAVDKGRITLGAVKGLLARLYLYQGNMTKVAEKTQQVIDLGVYDLNPKYGANFCENTENGIESILEVQFEMDAERATDMGRWTAPQGNPQDSIFTVNADRGENSFTATEDIYEAYEDDDRRKSWNFSRVMVKNGVTIDLGKPYITKYRDFGSLYGVSSFNYPVLRYSDILLMYAEAVGPTPEGYAAINDVRARAFGAPNDLSALTPDEFRQAVLLERRLEFFAEGLRRWDLIRTNTLLEKVKAQDPQVLIQPYHVLYPIPQQERSRNKNLTQNDGY